VSRPFGLTLGVSKEGEPLPAVELPPQAVYTFGRHSGCDVVLDHPSLSRQHAALAFDSAGVPFLADLGSTHGTYINGVRLDKSTRKQLLPGDTWSFGGSKRAFRLSGAMGTEDSMPPPPPRRTAQASSDDAMAASGGDSAVRAVDAAAARAQRETEIRAVRESFNSAPVVKHPHVAGFNESSEGGGSEAGYPEPVAADVYDDSDDDDGEGEGSVGVDVPTGFVSRRVERAAAVDRSNKERAAAMRGGGSAAAMSATARSTAADRAAAAATASRSGGDVGSGGGASSAATSLGLPVSHEVALGGHVKAVTCLALDASGARLMSGGSDYTIRLYDFGAMDREHKAFRDVVPQDGQPVHAIGVATTGGKFVVATGSAKATMFDRNGTKLLTTFKGDVYVTDMANTKGHTASLTAAQFVPGEGDQLFMTASRDGSVRFWPVEGKTMFEELLTGDILKVKNSRALRAAVTAAALSPDGKVLIATADDGSVQMFNVKAAGHKYLRPDGMAASAHLGGEVTGVTFAPDGTRFCTRGTDDVVAVWDIRRFGQRATPVAVITGVPTIHPTANCAWSPDGRLLLAGLEARAGEGDGAVCVFDVPSLEAAAAQLTLIGQGSRPAGASSNSLASSPAAVPAATAAAYTMAVARGSSVVSLAWHERINQVFAGCSDGATHVLYDPELSRNGALMSASKAPKRRDAGDFARIEGVGHIVTVNSLPLFREAIPGLSDSRKRRIADLKPDTDLRDHQPYDAGLLAKLRANPALPVDEPTYLQKGTRTFTQHYVQTLTKGRNLREEDPSAVLREYDERARAAGSALTRAYAVSQPKAVLADETVEQEDARTKDELDRMLGMKAAAAVGKKI
jgi:WD repeat-containing protein 70